MRIRERNELQVLVGFEHGLESQQGRVDGPAKRRRGHQFDLGVVGEAIPQVGALFLSQRGEIRVVQRVVCGAEVVVALTDGSVLAG